MDAEQPQLIVLAGPNGAGKSTGAKSLLEGAIKVTEFVNADVIARGLSAFHPEKVAIEAGQIMLERLHNLAAQRCDFAFETTLASRTFAPWISRLCDGGYSFHLAYFWLPSPEMAVARVADRVRLGGHDVPAETIHRRYYAGLRNFFALYQRLTETWTFYDNSQRGGARVIASGGGTVVETIRDPESWEQIQRSAAE
jgi:predicted ABC-type ATPase